MTFIFAYMLSECNLNEVNTIEKISPTVAMQQNEVGVSTNNNIENAINPIEVYVNKFNESIEKQNSDDLAKIVSKEGFVLLRTFLSGFGTRGTEVSELIRASNIPINLEFTIVKEESPISLKTEFQSEYKEFSEMEIINTYVELNWQNLIKPEILNTFEEIVSNDKELGKETRIYVLKEGGFCLAQFAGSGLQYSRWVAFEKTEKGYAMRIIAIIN